MYGKGAGYNVFAGKDASKGLGMSSLDPKDAVSDYSSLNEAQIKTLDQWEGFFEKVNAPRSARLTPALQRRRQGRCRVGSTREFTRDSETDARTSLTRLRPPFCMNALFISIAQFENAHTPSHWRAREICQSAPVHLQASVFPTYASPFPVSKVHRVVSPSSICRTQSGSDTALPLLPTEACQL